MFSVEGVGYWGPADLSRWQASQATSHDSCRAASWFSHTSPRGRLRSQPEPPTHSHGTDSIKAPVEFVSCKWNILSRKLWDLRQRDCKNTGTTSINGIPNHIHSIYQSFNVRVEEQLLSETEVVLGELAVRVLSAVGDGSRRFVRGDSSNSANLFNQ